MKRFPASMLATCVIPWREDFSFDEELFRAEVRLLRDRLTRRLYLFGTAGEGYAVSDRQFQQIVAAFRAEMSGPQDHPMVGVLSLSGGCAGSGPVFVFSGRRSSARMGGWRDLCE